MRIAVHVFLSGVSFKIKAPSIAESMGAKAIYVIDPINYRVQHAIKNGAEHVFKSVDDFVQYKNGSGVDLVFEATNSPEGLNLSIHAKYSSTAFGTTSA